MMDRSADFLLAMISAIIYVYLNSKERAIHYRVLMVASSAGFGFSLAPEASKYLGIGETLSGVLIIVFGYLILDLFTSIISDRAFMKSLIKRRFK